MWTTENLPINLLTHREYFLSTQPSDDGPRGVQHCFVSDKPLFVSLMYFLKVPWTLGEESNADHTLIRCKAFDGERNALIRKIGPFNSPDLVSGMLRVPGFMGGNCNLYGDCRVTRIGSRVGWRFVLKGGLNPH